MKKNLAYSLMLGILLLTTASFAVINTRPVKKGVAKKTAVAVKPKFTCVADMNFGLTLVSLSTSSATVSWGYTGSPASFNYAGYYNVVPGGSVNITPGNVTAPTHQLTIPIPAGTTSFRIGFACVCSDGTVVGSGHGALIHMDGSIMPF